MKRTLISITFLILCIIFIACPENPTLKFTLNTNTNGNGSIILDPNGGTYEEGTTVTITANPDSGWMFDGWSGDITGSTNPETITMDSDKSITVTFLEEFTVTTGVIGNGTVTLDPSGGVYPDGTTVTVTANPDTGWAFGSWTGDLSGVTNPANLLVNGDKSIIANFIEEYTLTTNVTGNGTITLDPSGGVYPEGTTVTVTANPDTGWIFDGWSGDLSGNTNPTTIYMNGDKSITADFIEEFTLSTNITGNGTVTLDPSGGVYTDGTTVTITANPDSGYDFYQWSGDSHGVINPITINMTSDKTINVEFLSELSVINFPDANLENIIRTEIGKPSGDIYYSDVQTITSLVVDFTDITDLSGMEYCVNITIIDFNVNNYISDLNPISNLTKLTELYIEMNDISDISPISNLKNLTVLNLFNNNLVDISPISSLTNLTEINLGFNDIIDISPLSTLNNLTKIMLKNNDIIDISSLSSIANLSYLDIFLNQVSDLTPISGLTNIDYLHLADNNITDLTPISSYSNISTLNLSNNNVSDLSPISSLTTLTYLNIAYNDLSDINPISTLVNIETLSIKMNTITDINTISSLSSLTHLNCEDNGMVIDFDTPNDNGTVIQTLYDDPSVTTLSYQTGNTVVGNP